VNQRLRIGGPATAQAAWVDAIIVHTTKEHIPLDFVSTHAYGNDAAMDIVGHAEDVAPHQMLGVAIDKVHKQIAASSRPDIPLIWSEFNATYMSEREITDSVYMGPWLAKTISESDGKVNLMSYWTFSDVFEEQGVIRAPFFGGFGLIAIDHLPKPAFNVFRLLHSLGDERLPAEGNDVLVTRKKDGTLVLAAWNLAEPGVNVPAKSITLSFQGVKGNAAVSISRVDHAHGDVLAAYDKMGAPMYPSQEQLRQLREVEHPDQPEKSHLHAGSITLVVPVQGLAVVEVGR
jgi:xylan 1,4-beta-xylosidase